MRTERLTVRCVLACTVRPSLGCCGSEWRRCFPGLLEAVVGAAEAPAQAPAEAPVPPAARPATPARRLALGKGSGPAVSAQNTCAHATKQTKKSTLSVFLSAATRSSTPASLKSEGSPLQRQENAGKKPEERPRPGRPAVSEGLAG